MDRIFNMDNKFFTFMSRVADLIILNLLFIACCIPIVTIGPAITAMYYVTLKMARNEESYIARAFFKSFKENFKQGIAIWLIALAVIILEVMDFTIMGQLSGGGIYTAVKYGLMVIALLLIMILLYVFPVLAKFVNTVKNTIRNSFLMSIRHLPYTLLMLLICVGPLILMLLNNTIFAYGILAYILLGFSTTAFVNSMLLVKIFDKYIPHDEEDEEAESDEWTLEGAEGEELEDSGEAPVIEGEIEGETADETEEEEDEDTPSEEA